MLFINIEMKCHKFSCGVAARHSFPSTKERLLMFSHHWKSYFQIDSQLRQKYLQQRLLSISQTVFNVGRGKCARWTGNLLKSGFRFEFGWNLLMFNYIDFVYDRQIIPKSIQSEAICWNEWVWIFWREHTEMTNDSVSPNMKYGFEFAGELVACVICFCFLQVFSSVRWVHSIFGLAAWMEMRYKTQYNGERNAHSSEYIVPFVYVFALGWQNNSTEFFSLCSRLHSSSLRHS